MVDDGDLYVRLENLIKHLQEGKEKDVRDMASKLGMSCRSTYRMIGNLEEIGFRFYRNSSKEYCILKLPDAANEAETFDLNLSDRESCLVSSILKGMFYAVPGTDRTNRAFQIELGRRFGLDYLGRMPELDADGGYKNVVNRLLVAIDGKKQVELSYCESDAGRRSKVLIVEPYLIYDNMRYVNVFDTGIMKCVTLNIQQIDRVRIRDDTWTHEQFHRHYAIDVFGCHSPCSYDIDLKLRGCSKRVLVDMYPRCARYIAQSRDGPHLRTTVNGLDAPARFVLAMADQVEVIEGQELRDYLRKFTQRYWHRYSEK